VEAYKILIKVKDGFSKPFKKVTAMLGKIGGMAKSVGKVVGGLGLVVAAAAAAFVALGKKAFDALDTIGKTADRTGIATDKLQALRLGAVESGATVEDLNKSMEKFAKNIGDVLVKGTGEATYALDKMGIQLRDNTGRLKSTDTLLTEVVGGIGKLGSESERTSVLMALFGKPGLKLNYVLGKGAEAMEAWTTKAKEMGIIIDASAITAVENFNDRMTEVKFMLDGLVRQTFAALAPGLETMITRFKDWAVETAKTKGGLEEIGKTIADTLIGSLALSLVGIGNFLNAMEEFIVGFKNGFIQASIAVAKFADSIPFTADQTENIIALQGQLTEVTGSMGMAMNNAAMQVMKLGQGMLDTKTPITDIKDGVDDVINSISVAEQAFDSFGTGFSKISKNGSEAFEDLEKLGEKVGKSLEAGLTDAFMNIGKGAEGLKNTMDSILKMIIAELIRVFVIQRAIGAVGTFFGFPPMAKGGPVSAGTTYLVGEQGPELFTPGRSGGITPNHALGGGGTTNVNITYDIKAFDAQSATSAIAEQAPTIVGIVEQSFRKRGKRGPLGA
tara:strand:+ start:1219 stop:2895 length:1677 start_codon:yes stop_codon:yes gene_type:complete